MMIKGLNVLQSYKGKALYEEDSGLVIGQLASLCVELSEEPKAQWNGTQIPADILHQCASFSKFCADMFGGEVQGRLYYDRKTGEWATAVVKQYVSRSLRSKETGDDGDIEFTLSQLPDGHRWIQIGTWHSHGNNCDAHQSTIDLSDEIKQNGIHLTFGLMADEVYDVHTRITHNGINYDMGNGVGHGIFADDYQPNANMFIEPPNWWLDMLIERKREAPKKSKVAGTAAIALVEREPRKALEIGDKQYQAFHEMVEAFFPDEEVGRVFSALASKFYTDRFAPWFDDAEAIDEYNGQFACIFCGQSTESEDCICESCVNRY
jgi:hypothetical protein